MEQSKTLEKIGKQQLDYSVCTKKKFTDIFQLKIFRPVGVMSDMNMRTCLAKMICRLIRSQPKMEYKPVLFCSCSIAAFASVMPFLVRFRPHQSKD